MTLADIFVIPIVILLILMLGLTVQETLYKKEKYKKYLTLGLITKIIGSLLYCFLYTFYYGGDTTNYHEAAKVISGVIMTNPSLGWEIMTNPAATFTYENIDIVENMKMFLGENTFMVVRIAALFNLFCFNSFWGVSIIFGALSFTGMWAMYRVFVDRYPSLQFQMAIAVLFMPSVFFWGSGIMKDTITMGCLGWMLWGLYQLFIKNKKIPISMVIVVVTFFLLAKLKIYIIIGFLPAMLYWLIAHYMSFIKEQRLRFFIIFSTFICLGYIGYNYQDNINAISNALFMRFVQMAYGFQSWHEFLAQEGQSGYTLGEIKFTISGVLSKFPASVNVTLFRPYLHEVKNINMLLTSLESTSMLLFTLYVFIRTGILKTFKLLFSDHFIVFCFIFSLLFAFAVGFTSYNFGALARYKIPCLPFYIAALFLILHKHKQQKMAVN